MKFGVITFPGSNCDQDMIYVLQDILGQEVEELWHKDTDLKGCDAIVLPGGFSYGDYLRSGAIARFSPVMTAVIEHANKGGFVLGVCNGFQILCESGLLPGALLHNNNQKFICKNVYLKPESKSAKLTEQEIKIIAYLNQSLNPVPVSELQEKIWGYNNDLETHTVETHIYRLRQKIFKIFKDNDFLLSLKNGYYIKDLN